MIVSASRRTDIPAFYMPWLLGRLEAGYCVSVNPFNPRQRRRVSLRPDDVDAIVFWTRRPDRIAETLERIESLGHTRTAALVTITGLPAELEPHSPPSGRAVAALIDLAGRYGDPRRVAWRYDPILLGPEQSASVHRRRFERLARQLRGSTRRVIVSFLDRYLKAERRLAALRPGGYPLGPPDSHESSEAHALIRDLAQIAKESGMDLEVCAEPVSFADAGAPPARCIDASWLAELFPDRGFPQAKHKGQREHCGCAPSIDIGMPDTCLHGCVYCYATRSHERALAAHARHDLHGVSLLPLAAGD